MSEETDEGFDSRYDRLLKEGAEVADRLDKLNNFLNGSRRNTIPDNQIMLLDLQRKYMALYSCILEVRIVELKGEMDG